MYWILYLLGFCRYGFVNYGITVLVRLENILGVDGVDFTTVILLNDFEKIMIYWILYIGMRLDLRIGLNAFWVFKIIFIPEK